MAVKVMGLVWERAPYSCGSLLVLLALADWADDEGLCWPSVQKLAHKARIKRRSTQYILRKLETDGIIKIEEKRGRGNQNKYKINVQKLRLLPERKGADGDIENVQLETQKAQSATQKAQPIAPDPLVEPSAEPPSDPLRASREPKTIKDYISTFDNAIASGSDPLSEIESIPDRPLRNTLLEWREKRLSRAA